MLQVLVATVEMQTQETPVKRCATVRKRIYKSASIMFAGGIAYNPYMHVLSEEESKQQIFVPCNSPIVGAYGAVLLAL